MNTDSFASRLLAWHARHGRHDLPWAVDRTPYRVWLSEIMLQQTQVATVIPYFARFVARFPDLPSLAAAPLDEVLHLWTGLGYYSRARNLHRTAERVVAEHDGELPRTLEALMDLPGIGRSTAAAILAQAHELPHAILDGNVKRVLARYHAIAGWPDEPRVHAALWVRSEEHLPQSGVRDYTQALMDLGATVCTRNRPRCADCPLVADCAAHADGRTAELPTRKPRRALPQRACLFLVVEDDAGAVLLERRPPSGLWGGLWCFPELPAEAATGAADVAAALGLQGLEPLGELPAFEHTFTHFRLSIRPLRFRLAGAPAAIADGDRLRWHVAAAPTAAIGLSAAVVRLLRALAPASATFTPEAPEAPVAAGRTARRGRRR